MKLFKMGIAAIVCATCMLGASCGGAKASFAVTAFNGAVDLVHQEVLSYINSDGEQLVSSFLPSGAYRHDKGQPVTLGYDPGELDVKSASLEISKNQDFSVVEVTESIGVRSKSIKISNLYPDTTYYFRISLTLADGKVVTNGGTFTTSKSPRLIDLDGASNVRDIGGWKTEDGKQIKYGLVYRGSELDGGKNTGHPDFNLSYYGMMQAEALGIKTDIDLRSESVKVGEYSVLGEDVTRKFYNSAQYESILKPENAERTRKIFSDHANPGAYPVYVHCTHGVDRAGSVILLLEGLLGVSKSDLIKDYELSAFYHNYKHVNRNVENGGNILALIEGIEAFEGDTFAQKVESFLLSIGVTATEISNIRTTLLV
jgi:hypothetical protein